jgi:hypothetical protein
MSKNFEAGQSERPEPAIAEGDDFYFEEGLMVLTAKYLRDRGFCCGNLCRHCPYPKQVQADAASKKKFF